MISSGVCRPLLVPNSTSLTDFVHCDNKRKCDFLKNIFFNSYLYEYVEGKVFDIKFILSLIDHN